MSDTIEVVVNGEPRAVLRNGTLLDLLETLHLDPRAVVVEHNRTIVRRPASSGGNPPAASRNSHADGAARARGPESESGRDARRRLLCLAVR